MLSRGHFSLYEVARIIILSEARAPELISWLHQFAVDPRTESPAIGRRPLSSVLPLLKRPMVPLPVVRNRSRSAILQRTVGSLATTCGRCPRAPSSEPRTRSAPGTLDHSLAGLEWRFNNRSNQQIVRDTLLRILSTDLSGLLRAGRTARPVDDAHPCYGPSRRPPRVGPSCSTIQGTCRANHCNLFRPPSARGTCPVRVV